MQQPPPDSGGRVAAALLDVGGTLIECRPSVAAVYARVLSRWQPVTEAAVAPAFRRVWTAMTQEHPAGLDRYHLRKGGEREWWGRFVARVLAELDHPASAPEAFAQLFAAFAEPELWHVFPEVPEALAALRARGLRLAVVSNWDSRLPALLDRLDLTRSFDTVLVSGIEGVEKPAPEIFLRAAARLGCGPGRCVHVGDSPLDDYRGAESAGVRPVLLDRAGAFDGGYVKVRDLRGVCELLD